MSKSIALLEYTYMFDPTTTWQNGSQFEKDQADFFAAHGLQGDVLEVKGNSSKRVILITRIEEMPKLDNKAQSTPSTILTEGRQKVIVQPKNNSNRQGFMPRSITKTTASERDFKKGRFLPTKGYVKR